VAGDFEKTYDCRATTGNGNFFMRIAHTKNSSTLNQFQFFILIAPVFLFSMVAHEYAHGYAALKQGDTTAYSLGRLTWNPIPHIDLFMTIILPVLMFVGSHGTMALGGAKPVPVVPRNYRNFKRGDIIVSLAGVATNMLIAVVCVPLMVLVGVVGRAFPMVTDTAAIIQSMLRFGIVINLSLTAFNLIPIPPLDGSHVFKYLLPPVWALNYQRIGAQGLVILVLLITLGRPLLRLWFAPVFYLDMLAARAVSPYILPSQWTM
jgi:Zn-dependent protease